MDEKFVKPNILRSGILSAAAFIVMVGFDFYSDNFTALKAIIYFFVWVAMLLFLNQKLRFVETAAENGVKRYRAEILGGFKTVAIWLGLLMLLIFLASAISFFL